MNRRVLFVAAAVVLSFLAFPPAALGPLGFVALAPLHLAVRGAGVRRGAWLGFGYGFGANLLLFEWLLHVDAVRLHHLLILATYLALYPAALGAVWSRLADRPAALILVPALAVTLDWVRGHAGFLACPWLTLGQSQHANVPLLQLASIGGEPLVALVVVGANVAVGQLLSGLHELRKRAALALGVVLVAHGSGPLLASGPGGTKVLVALIQPDFSPTNGRVDAFTRLDELTREAAKAQPRLIVWPESAAGDIEGDVAALFEARAIVDRGGVPVLFGSSSVRGSTGHNSLFFMRPEVPVSEPYRKVRLVPFAEYAPRGLPNELGPRLFDVVPGAARRTFDLDGVTIEPLICFESLFADDVRATASAAPSIIAVAVNDSWFGATAGPALHNLVSAFRAVENRRPVVVASNGGPSQIVDADGRIVAKTVAHRAAAAAATVRVDVPPGPYRRWGDRVWVGLVMIMLLGTAWSRYGSRRHG